MLNVVLLSWLSEHQPAPRPRAPMCAASAHHDLRNFKVSGVSGVS